MTQASPPWLAWTSVGTQDAARALARLAVEHSLAACVQIDQIASVYRWRDAVHEDPEWRLLFKTTRDAWPRLQALLREHHPYDAPVIYALEAAAAEAGTLAWLHGSVVP